MTEVNEHTVWARCLDGDMDSFKSLYLLFHPRLMSYGRHMIHDEELVEDCIQDLFVKLIQRYATLPSTQYVSAYIFKCFRNKLIDSSRSRKTTVEFDAHFGGEDALASEYTISPPLYNEGETSGDKIQFILDSLKFLSQNQQEIVYLYFIKGLRHEDIASVMDINYQSSKNLLSRAVVKLRRLFEVNYSRSTRK